MKKRKSSSKKRAIVSLSFVAVVIAIVSFFTFVSFDYKKVETADGWQNLKTYNSIISQIKLGIDLKGGVYAVMEVEDSEGTEENEEFQNNVTQTISILTDRLTQKGYPEATVVRQTSMSGVVKIRVEIPDVDDPDELFDIIGKPAVLLFKDPDGNTVISGSDVERAFVSADENGAPAVQLVLTSSGKTKFATASASLVDKVISITLDGEEISAPTVSAAITNGRPIISGSFTEDYASELAMQIQSGSLLVSFTSSETRIISPTLGVNAIQTGLIAGGVGILLVLIFMAIVYRGMGLAADIALAIYTLLLILFMALLPWVQLTLPGIAGIILGIGMAVDGNIIIFERIKDEYMEGKTLKASIDNGFRRARIAIIDSNITTLIAAIMLWILGTGSVQGFAITLFLSILLSMFTSLIVTKFLLNKFYQMEVKNTKFYGLTREDIENA